MRTFLPLRERLVASPCCNPDLDLDAALATYAGLGFRKFEVFSGWVKSAVAIDDDPTPYLDLAHRHGMRYVSLHLPVVGEDRSLKKAIRGAQFAAAIGVRVVLFKAASRELYIRTVTSFLDAVDDLGLTVALQNHFGSPICTLEDFAEVLAGIADPRIGAVLEVGHFHTAGVPWQAGYELLQGRIALVHIKDQIGPQSVPFGRGEIDLPGLFAHLHREGYTGDIVVEMEVADRENTLRYLQQAGEYLLRYCEEPRP